MGGSSSKTQQEKKRKEEEVKLRIQQLAREREELRKEEQRRRCLEIFRQLAREREALQEKQRKWEETRRFLGRLIQHKVSPNLDLLNDFRGAFLLAPLKAHPASPYQETPLDESSREYAQVSQLFRSTNKPYFTIAKIIRVENPFHVLEYNLMKSKYLEAYKQQIHERFMFHGTKLANLDGICTYNFDRSRVRTHKFGHGTSFARDAFFATHYHQDNKRSSEKVMIIARVLAGDMCQGNASMNIPEEPYYTSTNQDSSVIVKFDDATSFPCYIVHYEGLHPIKTSNRCYYH